MSYAPGGALMLNDLWPAYRGESGAAMTPLGDAASEGLEGVVALGCL